MKLSAKQTDYHFSNTLIVDNFWFYSSSSFSASQQKVSLFIFPLITRIIIIFDINNLYIVVHKLFYNNFGRCKNSGQTINN
jgi:hypothetical protein